MKLPPYDKFPTLFSKNIVLREVQTDDLKNLIDILFYDSEPALNLEGAISIQKKIDLDYANGTSIPWGIADKESNEIMGNVGFYRGFNKDAGEIGCVLRPEFRGEGFMTKAMKLAIEFGFNEVQLTKIIALTNKTNKPAIRLVERLRFVKTAELKEGEIEYTLKRNI